MKRKPRYSGERLGTLEVVKDFLPPPGELVMKDDSVKVTIALSRRSVDFFKEHAAQADVPYQRMIRNLLDHYAAVHSRR